MAKEIPLSGTQIARLTAALEEALTLDGLRQMLRSGFDESLSVSLDSFVAVQGRNLHDICHDLVLWALHDKRIGLLGLLAAAVRCNPGNPQLAALQKAWAGVTFTRPICPYPGMKPFTAEWGYFYGREAESQDAVDCLRRFPFLAIIGPSGSGKSSLLHAGILPALAQSHYFADKRWVVCSLRPGAAPQEALAAVSASLPASVPGTRLLLVVDQYEELYTMAAAEQRSQFEEALAGLGAQPGVCTILCARADFYANLMGSALWPAISTHRMEITPLRGEELRQAIVLPARDVGVAIEPPLVERLLADAGSEPGVLPFVQETLVMLWAHTAAFSIGLDAYTRLVRGQSGRSGLQVALAKHADDVYDDMLAGPQEQALTRRVLLRLVQFGEGRADTRRQQTVDELRKGSGDGAAFDKVLAALTANRILTLSDEAREVDLSHEALIQGWPQLAAWIDKRRAAELARRRLEEQAQARQRLRRDDDAGGLLDPVELAEAEAWVQSEDAAELGVSDELRTLIADSRAAIEQEQQQKEELARLRVEQAEQEAKLQAQRAAAAQEVAETQARAAAKLRRRNQGLALAFAAALVAVAVAVLFFINAQNEAHNARAAEAMAQANAVEAGSQRNLAEANAAAAANAQATAQANALLADNARATAQANLSLAEQKLDELKVEQLLASARAKKAQLDAPGAIADFHAAAEAAQARGTTLDVAAEISDTLRYVATQLVQEGEKVLCEARSGAGPQCDMLVTGIGRDDGGSGAAIEPQYLAWAREVAPEIRGWTAYTDTVRQQAVITASALFSQALALEPPANTAVYVWIAPGTFAMGSKAEDCVAPGFGECPVNEQPQHAVALDGYWMGRTAVTNEQYARCVQAEVCKPPANSYWQMPSSAHLPVTDVSWTKATQYAALVGGRLPTEAEWEYGCRGTDGRMYPWGNEPAEAPRLNYYNEYGRTIDVGNYAPGANGLYDMAGNVWEWTADWYNDTYYADYAAAGGESPVRNPLGPAETGARSLRGGSWRNDGNLVRCAYRDNDPPSNKYYNVGLRVVAPGF